jgi:hypothetical protein
MISIRRLGMLSEASLNIIVANQWPQLPTSSTCNINSTTTTTLTVPMLPVHTAILMFKLSYG